MSANQNNSEYRYPGVRILSLGVYIPDEVVTNVQLAKEMKTMAKAVETKRKRKLTPEEKQSSTTSHKWIYSRTGIESRRRASERQATSDLGTAALLDAVNKYGLPLDKIGFIIVASTTQDHLYSPSTGCIIQHQAKISPWVTRKMSDQISENLELRGIFTVDVELACSSFMAGLQLGHALISSGQYQYGVVVAADKMSTTVNYLDRRFSALLGDAAGCVLLGACNPEDTSFIKAKDSPQSSYFFMGSMGEFAGDIICPAGGSRLPITAEMLADPFHLPNKLQQDGKAVFKNMINLVYDAKDPQKTIIGQALIRSGLKLSQMKLVALHQANARMIRPIGGKIRQGGFRGRNIINIMKLGNVTSPALLLCLYSALQNRWLNIGD